MATWASYLGLGKKTEEAPKTTTPTPIATAEKFTIKPIDLSSSYGGKAAEDAIVEPIKKATEVAQSKFTKGSRRTKSDMAPIPQVTQTITPRRTQSNASRVAKMFGYGSPAPGGTDRILEIPAGTEMQNPETITSEPQMTVNTPKVEQVTLGKVVSPVSSRDVIKSETQPNSLVEDQDEGVDELVVLEAERALLEFERKSELIRIQRDEMIAEREKMFRAQEEMRKELERITQEEAEMLEYYKIMGIEEPRTRRIVSMRKASITEVSAVVQESPQVDAAFLPSETLDKRAITLNSRQAKQLELDREIARREAKKREEDSLISLQGEETLDILDTVIPLQARFVRSPGFKVYNNDSESEYEDEYVDDDNDSTQALQDDIGAVNNPRPVMSFQDEDAISQARAKDEYEADVLRYQRKLEEAERSSLEAQQMLIAEEKLERSRLEESEKLRAADVLREAEIMEEERMQAERMERERLEDERVERKRMQAESMERERLDGERLERERIETRRLENERQERERIEAERIEYERLEYERLEFERLEYERLENERLENERLENERLENERLERERLEEEELARIDEMARQKEDALRKQEIEQEAREQQRLEADRIAKLERNDRQRTRDAELKAEQEIRNAQIRADKEASIAEEMAFEKAEEIRKAEEKMRLAFAAMAAEKGGVPIEVPTLLPAVSTISSTGRMGSTTVGGLSNQAADLSAQSFFNVMQNTTSSLQQNTIRTRPSIRGGLPSGPKGLPSGPKGNPGLLPARRKMSMSQDPNPAPKSATAAYQGFYIPSDEPVTQPEPVLRPRPSIRGGLPSGPKGGNRPPQRNVSMDQRTRGGP